MNEINSEDIKEVTGNYSYDPIRSASIRLMLGFFLLVIGFLSVLISEDIADFMVPDINYSGDRENHKVIKSISSISGGAGVLLGLSIYLLYYLKYGFTLPPKKNFKSEIEELEEAHRNNALRSEILELKNAQRNIVERIENNSITLSEEEKIELLEKLKGGLSDQVSKDILSNIEESYSVDVITKNQISGLRKQLSNTTSRLNTEIGSLTRRGNLNLIIGSMAAIAGIIILSTTVFGDNSPAISINNSEGSTIDFSSLSEIQYQQNMSVLVMDYLPRLSLVLIVEIFAFFFLRLYRNSLDGIKYFQNELTNVESKFIGLEGAILSQDKDLKGKAFDSYVNTERNHILKKGESTADLERSKIDSQNLSKALDSIKGIAGKVAQ